MKRLSNIFCPLVLCLLASCVKTERLAPEQPQEQLVAVNLDLSAGGSLAATRAFSDTGTSRVDRVLILPFAKTNEALPDDDANFVLDYSLIRQIDLADPLPNEGKLAVSLFLQPDVSYKIAALGFGQQDFDYADLTNPNATLLMVVMKGVEMKLSDFMIQTFSMAHRPELFGCMCHEGGDENDTVFNASGSTALAGTLTRMVGGFSVRITDIPDYVTSISLIPKDLTVTVNLYGVPAYTLGEPYYGLTLETLEPDASGTVEFEEFLFAAFDPMSFRLDVMLGTSIESYTVTTNSGVTTFPIAPNQAINLSGSYAEAINFGFTAANTINLDDDAWDGLNP